jgi:hypothetical protein
MTETSRLTGRREPFALEYVAEMTTTGSAEDLCSGRKHGIILSSRNSARDGWHGSKNEINHDRWDATYHQSNWASRTHYRSK